MLYRCMEKPKMSTLYLVRGCPGTGKTRFSNTVFSGISHFENDMYFMRNGKYMYDRDMMPRAIEWCMENVESCLRQGIDVCVSNTFTKVRYIDVYKRMAEEYGADFKVYRMMGEFKNIHDVPHFILKSMKDNFEDYEGEIFVYPNLGNNRDSIPYTEEKCRRT